MIFAMTFNPPMALVLFLSVADVISGQTIVLLKIKKNE